MELWYGIFVQMGLYGALEFDQSPTNINVVILGLVLY